MADETELKRDLWKRMADSPLLMVALTETGGHSEPLTAQLDRDQADRLWFFVSRHNRLAPGGKAIAQFVSKGHDYFACLAGNVSVDNDPAMIDKHWSQQVQSWFPQGKQDPDLCLLRFDIQDAELWEADMSLSGKLKMLFGRKIHPSEEVSHAHVKSTAG